MKLGEIMYKQNSQADQGFRKRESTNASKENSKKEGQQDENVVDADFEEVDEDSEKKPTNSVSFN